MAQGVLPFQYEQEKTSIGMTTLAGLHVYLDLADIVGLAASVERHARLRDGGLGAELLS